MSDVLQTARKYQQKLSAELSKIEEFIRFAKELSEKNGSESPLSLTNPAANSTASEVRAEELPRPSVDQAEAKKSQAEPESETSQADPEPEKTERKSLFRGTSKLGDADRIADRVKGVA